MWNDLILEIRFHIKSQIEAMFNISKFSQWPLFWGRDKSCLLEVILEVVYTSQIAIGICDIWALVNVLVEILMEI